MKKILLLTVTVLFTAIQSIAQVPSFNWVKTIGSTNDEQSNSVKVDNLGNVYTVGEFEGTADFDPNSGVSNLTSNGFDDVFIQKLDSNGNFVWAKSIGGKNIDKGYSVALDASANVYITGSYKDTVDFDPGPGTYNLISEGNDDIYILKLDAQGNFVWAKTIGSPYSGQVGHAIHVDNSGNIYVTGGVSGPSVDFDPGPGVFNLAADNYDFFILKLNANGNFAWATVLGNANRDTGYGITVDDNGNVYTTGNFKGTADFDPSSNTYNLTADNAWGDIFIQKLDANGNFVWAKSMGGLSTDVGYSIAVDASGNVYTAGMFIDNTVDFDPGPNTLNIACKGASDMFVHKLDANGNLVWVRTFGDSGGDAANAITLDAYGDVYFAGHYRGTIDFDPGPSVYNLTSGSDNEIFIAKLSANGDFVWAQSCRTIFGGNSALSMALDNTGNIYTTGILRGAVDFNPDTAVANNVYRVGGRDVFVLKLGYSVNCTNTVSFGQTAFKNALLDHGVGITGPGISVIDTDGDGEICVTEAQAYTGTLDFSSWSYLNNSTGIEAFTNVTVINCGSLNQFTSLDVSNATNLVELRCAGNQIGSLDVSQNTVLTTLICATNQLTSLDVSNNTSLQELDCQNNSITTLDVSGNTALNYIYASENELTTLNVANGNNSNLQGMLALFNPNLFCIQHDSGFDPTIANNWQKDSTASWSNDCSVIPVNSITVQGQNGVSSITTNGGTLQMEADVLPVNADDMTYTWSVTNGTGSATIDANGLLTATTNGIVTVTATANDGSGVSGSADITISNQGAAIDNVVFENLSIYPNPTNDIINIEVQENLNSIQLFDITGKRVQAFHAQSKQLDVSTIKAGIYFLEIANSKKKSVIKIIKR